MRRAAFVISLTLAAAVPASATPNIFGSTGLITVPTAKTMDPREVAAHFHAGERFHSYGASYGLMDRMEIGVTLITARPGNPLGVEPRVVIRGGAPERRERTATLANAKYVIIQQKSYLPGVAVGAADIFDTMKQGPTFYAVASKEIVVPTPLRKWSVAVHGGMGTGAYNNEPFLGAEVGLGAPFSMFTFGLPVKLVAELSAGRIGGGARLELPLGFTAEAGTVGGKNIYGGVSFKRRF